jgi:hypothetical protein
MQIVIEAHAMSPQTPVQSPLACMTEGWMANIMDQGKRFSKVFIEPQGRGDLPRYLRHFNGVRESATEVIGSSARKHLSFPRKSPERTGLDYTVTVAHKHETLIACRSGKRPPCKDVLFRSKDATGM